MTKLRIGHGYDVHRLAAGRSLILGGVTIPYDRGLDGHSDADVLTHAVMDALLGAAALGDIGQLFPDSDDAFLNISSLTLLSRVRDALTRAGYRVVNIDATLIAQAPKVGPYRTQMQENMAAALGIDVDRVNVKATTEEHLGFTGDGSGMSAHAVALIEKSEKLVWQTLPYQFFDYSAFCSMSFTSCSARTRVRSSSIPSTRPCSTTTRPLTITSSAGRA